MLFVKSESLSQLVHSDAWPRAVERLCLTKEDERLRAQMIYDHLVEDVAGKKVLDYGGDLLEVIKEHNPVLAVDGSRWLDYAPYDLIVLHDILDHSENPVDLLRSLKGVLAEGGIMRVRCHPWCSRSGGHLCHQLNKAYLHVVFNDEELRHLGVELVPVTKVITPQRTYLDWIVKANLEVSWLSFEYAQFENFFEHPRVRERIMAHWKTQTMPYHQLERHYLNYELKDYRKGKVAKFL